MSQYYLAQDIGAGKSMTKAGNHIGHQDLQLLPAAKSWQNVVVRNLAALETVNVLNPT